MVPLECCQSLLTEVKEDIQTNLGCEFLQRNMVFSILFLTFPPSSSSSSSLPPSLWASNAKIKKANGVYFSGSYTW